MSEIFNLSLKSPINMLLDLVYPSGLYCCCCGKIIDDSRRYSLCDACLREFKWANGRLCKHCGKPLSEKNPSDVCFNCREYSHYFRRGYCCVAYGSIERKLIYELKYSGATYIAAKLAEIMYDKLVAVLPSLAMEYDCIIPVPLYGGKQKERGFNQAALIARELSRLTGLRTCERAVLREHKTKVLRNLDPSERRDAIRGAFGISPDFASSLNSKRILILDDIYTTGATIDEIARILLDAGAGFVDFVSFASGADVLK